MKKQWNYPYASALAEHLQAFIAEKRSCGYLYNNEAKFLYQFDRFIRSNDLDYGEINQTVVDAWCKKKASECHNSRNYRVDALRGFCHYLNALGIKATIPPSFRGHPRPLHFIPTRKDMQEFFKFIDGLQPHHRVKNTHFLIRNSVIYRLFYCTGMRLSEASNLRWEDLDFETGRLLIKLSKGDKHRVIYLHQDLLDLLKRYQAKLSDLALLNDWMFPSNEFANTPVRPHVINSSFSKLWRKFKGEQFDPKMKPTVHSLRHCYILTRLATWTEEHVDIKIMLPYLSAHLGHKGVKETYYYVQSLSHLVPAVKHFMEEADPLAEELYHHE